jgi:psiF repeat
LIKEMIMVRILVAGLLSLYAISASAADSSCSNQATEKKLAGAAKTSFMNKCERDAKASCDAAAGEKKLAGAAKTSFTNKCVKDAVGG